jgi:outer membrane biosynthesis protein TonB
MLAKVAVNSEGRVTNLRVIRLAWPKLPNSRAINREAVDSIKSRRYAPTIYDGKPVAVCSDVSVTVDLE